MRLDKYLKVSRLAKRRSVAKAIADQGRILINGKVAKSSSTVMIGDILELHYGNKTVTAKILDITEVTKKETAGDLYEIVSEVYKSTSDDPELDD